MPYVCAQSAAWMGFSRGVWVLVPAVHYWCLICIVIVPQIHNVSLVTQLDSLMHYKGYKVQKEQKHATSLMCETVHISFVCMGQCPREIRPMLKSLLHLRSRPLHFHILVDSASNYTFRNLFDTWALPDVKYTCYNPESHFPRVEWIPNIHSSGIYSMIRVLYPDVLPETVTRIISLDSDLTFADDVAGLWDVFNYMTGDQAIGLAEELTHWYMDASPRWPALGRGFNTGVMLLDLHKLRTEMNWTWMWQESVEENLPTLKMVQLSDQDVINAIVKKYPSVLYNVSCLYNLQTTPGTLAKKCYGNDRRKAKIIHWASPVKHETKVEDADYFRTIRQFYLNLDGYLLREKRPRCWRTQVDTYQVNRSDLCQNFRAAQRVKLRTHVHFMHKYSSIYNFDVTLVLHLSMDRLQLLERMARYWEGPLSAAIYLADCDVTKLESFIRYGSDTLSARKNIGYHLVFKHDSLNYPVNYLRNVALDNVNTPHVFLLDVECVPMAGLYKRLRRAIRFINSYPRKCLVVPAYEAQEYDGPPPRNGAALLVGSDDVTAFKWPRYTQWAQATALYQVQWQSNYEPYLVVHRSVPKYDTRLSDFDRNMVSHLVQLQAQGYKAIVLPKAFVIHTTHAFSADIYKPENYNTCLSFFKEEFFSDLKRKYNFSLKPDVL